MVTASPLTSSWITPRAACLSIAGQSPSSARREPIHDGASPLPIS
jgi:hypothetical protein